VLAIERALQNLLETPYASRDSRFTAMVMAEE
jgi:hypothetical protein